MSATRLLVLGMVRAHGRTHGYRLGADLHAMGADRWANIRWGSVYHALRHLTKRGLLRAFDDAPGDNGQPRTEYELTEDGEREFMALLRATVRAPDPHADMRTAGLAFLPALPRSEALSLLDERLTTLESQLTELKTGPEGVALTTMVDQGSVPSIVGELYGMWGHLIDSEIRWTRGLVQRLRDGAHTMAGEDSAAWGAPGSSG